MPRSLLSLALVLSLVLCVAAQPAFQAPASVPTGARPDGVAALDADGDGDMDLAVVVDGPDRVQFFLQGPAGTFTPGNATLLGAGASAQDLKAADLDGDGDQDLVVALKDFGTVVAIMNNGGLFSVGSSAAAGNEPRVLEVFDIDGNGTPDVVASNRRSNDVTIVRNTAGTLSTVANITVGAEPRGLSSADVDGDGDLDLAVAIHDGRSIAVLTNGGTGNFTVGTTFSVGFNVRPEGIAFGDFDGDGDQDLVATVSGNGINALGFFANQGGLSFGPRQDTFLTFEPGLCTAADLDLDGDADVAAVAEDNASLMVVENLGGGSFAAQAPRTTGLTPERVLAADMDGNGSADLVTSNRDSSTLSVFLNTASGMPTNPLSLTPLSNVAVGQTTTLQIDSPSEGGFPYFCGFSGGRTPGFTLPDGRPVALNFDFLFIFSLDPSNGVFLNNVGNLDPAGTALVTINVPPFPQLAGTTVFTAFATGDMAAPSGIASISPTISLTVQ